METQLDRAVLGWLRDHAVVPAELLERAAKAAAAAALDGAADPGRMLEWLVDNGALTRAQLTEVVIAIASEPPTLAEARVEPTAPPHWGEVDEGERGQRPPEVPADWNRYHTFSVVGEGGMGTVYRAFDPRLRRWVALKFLRADDREVAEACLREARAQARVDHPNVCQIYEVGEAGRRLYIAMQFIEGRTLRSLAKELSVREVAEIAADVARALHAAHLEGLVHRDVKPSNIMVERTADGRWRPFVLDFGLARDLTHSSGHTVVGAVLGTPSYMAPEQARGEVLAIDPRTDVYSLGATLYDVLSGAPPFDGSIAEVLVQVLQQDATALRKRRPDLPPDLSAVVDRCIEKDPARRYPNARALAEDLERFLAREPVAARARSRWYVLTRRARQHRVAVAAAVLALVAAGSAAVVSVTSLLNARRQAALAQQFAREVTTVEESIRLVMSRPLHDTRPELEEIRRRLEWIAAETARAGRAGAGPGHHALASGYMALGEHARAEEHLKHAWDSGYRPPEVAFERALVLVARYREALAVVQRSADPDVKQARQAHLDEDFRRPALAFLQQARGALLKAPELAEAQIAFLEENLEEALTKARQARQRIPWLYQAFYLEGEVHRQRAREHHEAGGLPEALAALADAEAAYRQGIQLAPSDPAGYTGLCAAANAAFLLRAEQGSGPERSYREALGACAQALTADPGHLPAHRAIALAHLQWAQFQFRRGQDPSAALAQASASAQEVLDRSPDDPIAWTYLGIVTRFSAELGAARGEDPRPELLRAHDHLRRALALDPHSYLARNNLGLALLAAGLSDFARGEDPRPSMLKAVEAFESLLASHPRQVAALDNLSVALWAIGRWENAHGGDGEASFSRAEEVLHRALSINPADGVALNNLGLLAVERGAFLLEQGQDPTAVLASGQQTLERAILLNPDDPFAHTNMGQLHRLRAEWELRQGRSPRAILAAARHALLRARSVNPADAEAALAEGLCHLLEARATLGSTARSMAALARAEAAFRRALTLNPAYPEAQRDLARVHLERGLAQLARPASALQQLQAGLDIVTKVPSTPETILLRGELHLAQARLLRGNDRIEAARLAAELFTTAREENRWLTPRLEPLLAAAETLAR